MDIDVLGRYSSLPYINSRNINKRLGCLYKIILSFIKFVHFGNVFYQFYTLSKIIPLLFHMTPSDQFFVDTSVPL